MKGPGLERFLSLIRLGTGLGNHSRIKSVAFFLAQRGLVTTAAGGKLWVRKDVSHLGRQRPLHTKISHHSSSSEGLRHEQF